MIISIPTETIRVDRHAINRGNQHGPSTIDKGTWQMTDADDQTLKAEIDEIMDQVDAIMEKVARVIPSDKQETDGRE